MFSGSQRTKLTFDPQITQIPQNKVIRNSLRIFTKIDQFSVGFQTKTHFAMSRLVFITVLLTFLIAIDGRSVESQTENVIESQQAEDVTPNAAGSEYL